MATPLPFEFVQGLDGFFKIGQFMAGQTSTSDSLGLMVRHRFQALISAEPLVSRRRFCPVLSPGG